MLNSEAASQLDRAHSRHTPWVTDEMKYARNQISMTIGSLLTRPIPPSQLDNLSHHNFILACPSTNLFSIVWQKNVEIAKGSSLASGLWQCGTSRGGRLLSHSSKPSSSSPSEVSYLISGTAKPCALWSW